MNQLTLDRFAAELRAFAGGITNAERAMARACLADALACAAAGAAVTAHRRTRTAFADLDRGDSSATVWFAATRAGVLTAAYLNSVAVSAHDLDDGHRGAIGHPGGAVIPAVLAEAEHAATAQPVDVLDAVVFGYETALRIAGARDPARFERTATGRWASFAAAAVSWFVHRDPADILAHALAHAGSLAPQLTPPDDRAVDGVKEGTPWAVAAGLVAARLARAGIPGPTYLLERHTAFTPNGLARIVARHPGAILDTYFKQYGCCRWIHPVLDCVLTLQDRDPVRPEEIRSIEVLTFERSLRLSNRAAPDTLEEAHYSFPFCVGLAVADGANALLPIRSSALTSRAALAVARRVTLAVDAAHDAEFPARTPATVRIHTRRGTREMSAPTARGDPSLPLDAGTLQHKHRRLLRTRSPGRVASIAALLDDRTPVDVATLIAAVKPEAANFDSLENE